MYFLNIKSATKEDKAVSEITPLPSFKGPDVTPLI